MLDTYAPCHLFWVDLKLSSCGLATFGEHVRGNRHMMRDSKFGYAHQMTVLTKDGLAMTHWAAVRLVEGRYVPVMESMLEFSVVQAVQIEREGGSFFIAWLARSTVRLAFGWVAWLSRLVAVVASMLSLLISRMWSSSCRPEKLWTPYRSVVRSFWLIFVLGVHGWFWTCYVFF